MVKFVDLSAEFAIIKDELMPRIENLFASSQFVGGECVRDFERAFARFVGVKECVGVGNGTDALEIALKSLDLSPRKNEVILPANTFFASLESVLNAGYVARIIDCDEDYLMDFNALEKALESHSSSIGAIMPVHLYGCVCDMQRLCDLARKYGVFVIEDASQAHGGRDIHGNLAGSKGDVACFSFYPSKNLGAFGDGGAIVSENSEIIARCRAIANHGASNSRYNHALIGRNSRLDSLQAMILGYKLPKLHTNNAKRAQIAGFYRAFLRDINGIILPKDCAGHIYHLFVLCLERHLDRNKMRSFLLECDIESSVHYPYSLADLAIVRKCRRVKIESAKRAKKYAKSIISLPMGTHLDKAQVERVCSAIGEFVRVNA